MYKVNDYLVYGKDVCKVCAIQEKKFNDEDYYLLRPLKDETLKIEVPTNNNLNKIRDIISEESVKEFIKQIPTIDVIESDEKYIESAYKNLLQTPSPENLIKIIKTTYLRNKERQEKNKKLADKDTKYFELAEEYLYNEFSIALNMSYDETKEYIVNSVENLC